MDAIKSIEDIAQHENIDLVICRLAVRRIIAYYCPSGYSSYGYGPHQIADQLCKYITGGDNNRAMVVQFREYVRELMPAQA